MEVIKRNKKNKTCCRLFQKFLVKHIYQGSTYKKKIAGDEVIFHKAHYQNSSKHIYVYVTILNPLLTLDPDAPHENIRINTYNSLIDPYTLQFYERERERERSVHAGKENSKTQGTS